MWPFKNSKEEENANLARIRQELADIKLAVAGGRNLEEKIQEAIRESRRTLSKPLMYATPVGSSTRAKGSNSVYHGPVYDLSEIARAQDVEPYIRQSIRKHREQVLKEGYVLRGDEQEMVDYIKRRLFEMQLVSGVSVLNVFRDFVSNLVTYATAFIVLKRDKERSSGKPIRIHGKTLEPIAAIYALDPTSVSVRLNDHGNPVEWKQTVENSASNKTVVVFDADDVIIATIDRKQGFVFGTPYVLPVLDDVRALRRLEELAEVVCQKYAYPPLHTKVGTEKDPPIIFADGGSEIDIVRQEIENMPAHGGPVTSHRVSIDVIGAGEKVIDIHPYIEYFEARVLGGLRLSQVDIGRGEVSKASAQSVSQSLQDSAKDFQSVIEDVLTNELIIPLLLEGGFDVTFENIVRFTFPMINSEEERARQQHGMDMANNSMITISEFRKQYLSRRELTDEEAKDLKTNKDQEHDLEMAKFNAQAKVALQKSKPTSASSKNKSARRTVSNKTRPSNQSGKKATKTKITRNSAYLRLIEDEFKSCGDCVLDFIKKHGTGKAASNDPYDLNTKETELRTILDSFITLSMPKARFELDKNIQLGIKKGMLDLGIDAEFSIAKKYMDRFYKNYIMRTLRNFCSDITTQIYNNDYIAGVKTDLEPVVAASVIVDMAKDTLSNTLERHADISYRFGYIKTIKHHGMESFILTPIDELACDKCLDRGSYRVSLMSKDIPYSALLTTHSDCEFNISI